jgi:hypothetical protein
MNLDLAVVLLLRAAAVAMFVINKPRMDAVALIMIAALLSPPVYWPLRSISPSGRTIEAGIS